MRILADQGHQPPCVLGVDKMLHVVIDVVVNFGYYYCCCCCCPGTDVPDLSRYSERRREKALHWIVIAERVEHIAGPMHIPVVPEYYSVDRFAERPV